MTLVAVASQAEETDPDIALKILSHKVDPNPNVPKFNLRALDAEDALSRPKEELVSEVVKEVRALVSGEQSKDVQNLGDS